MDRHDSERNLEDLWARRYCYRIPIRRGKAVRSNDLVTSDTTPQEWTGMAGRPGRRSNVIPRKGKSNVPLPD